MWGRGLRGNSVAWLSAGFQSLPLLLTDWALLVLTPGWVGLCTFWDPVGLSTEFCCEAGIFCLLPKPPPVFTIRGFEALFSHARTLCFGVRLAPQLFSQFICKQMWDCLVHQLPPWQFRSSSHHLAVSPLPPGCPSVPFLPVWMNVSLTLQFLDFHTVWFYGSSSCFLFLNLSYFFWLCEEARCIYTCLHLGWKSNCTLFFALHLITHWPEQVTWPTQTLVRQGKLDGVRMNM